MWIRRGFVVFVCLAAALGMAASSQAQFDSLKKKAKSKVDQTVDKTKGEQPDTAATPAPGVGEAAVAPPTGESSEAIAQVSTKFDFVPGDNVLFFDDFQADELGEFPARWRLVGGTFEVAEMNGERWARCTSNDGRIKMKLPEMDALPEFWTLEFDFYATEPMSSALVVEALGTGENKVWEVTFPNGPNLFLRTGEIISSTPLEAPAVVPGRHHVMFMARGTALKVYLDRQRLANVPEVLDKYGLVNTLQIRLCASTKPMITNVRFAEGCRPPKDMLAEGKLVTYGIHFATGSDVVLPDSAPVLRQIAAYLQANPTVKLQVTGHTDNVGSKDSNLDLSKRRAASVAKVLTSDFGVAADRFATDGKGDAEAVASNANAEGRAMNRRVEFAKV